MKESLQQVNTKQGQEIQYGYLLIHDIAGFPWSVGLLEKRQMKAYLNSQKCFFFLNIKFLLVLLYTNTNKYNKVPSNKEKGMNTPKHQAAAAVTRCPNKALLQPKKL